MACHDKIHVMQEQIIKMHVRWCHERMDKCM